MRMRIAALCVILLFWGNVAEAWQAALTLKQLGQETCLQMVDYGEALLVETLEGLYIQRGGLCPPLGRLPPWEQGGSFSGGAIVAVGRCIL